MNTIKWSDSINSIRLGNTNDVLIMHRYIEDGEYKFIVSINNKGSVATEYCGDDEEEAVRVCRRLLNGGGA